MEHFAPWDPERDSMLQRAGVVYAGVDYGAILEQAQAECAGAGFMCER